MVRELLLKWWRQKENMGTPALVNCIALKYFSLL
jgi:hypothetical protein